MRQDPVTLSGLAFACFVYRSIYKDGAYKDFREKTTPHSDLNNSNHRLALFEWLRKWGIRSITEGRYEKLSGDIKLWNEKYNNKLPGKNKNLWSLCDSDLDSVDQAYKGLVEINWIGATAAGKILFGVRPKALVAWDNEIRKGTVGSNGLYASFIKSMRDMVKELCKKYNFEPEQLLKELKRRELIILKPHDDTILKLLDEYNWITITKECKPPDEKTLQRWDKWNKS